MSWHTLTCWPVALPSEEHTGPFHGGLGRLGKTFHELPSLGSPEERPASPLARAPCGALTVTPGPGTSCRLRTTTISGFGSAMWLNRQPCLHTTVGPNKEEVDRVCEGTDGRSKVSV